MHLKGLRGFGYYWAEASGERLVCKLLKVSNQDRHKSLGQLLGPQSHEQQIADTGQLKFGGVVVVELLKQLQAALILTDDAEAPDVVITEGDIAAIQLPAQNAQPHGFIATLGPGHLQLGQVSLRP